jgi:hypothetical protein
MSLSNWVIANLELNPTFGTTNEITAAAGSDVYCKP